MKVSTKLILLICWIITFQNFQFSFAQISEYKVLPSDGSTDNMFGFSSSLSGDYLIIGVPHGDGNTNNTGSAYIFKREGTNWTEEQKLIASDGATTDGFGVFVSISGDYVIVGAYADDNQRGSAYIFKREGTNWTEEQKLIASDGADFDRFGVSASISGAYAIIGAMFGDGNASTTGSAYVFRKDSIGWTEEQKLFASDGADFDYFGQSVLMSGGYAFVGSRGDDDNKGSVYIFERDSINWIEKQKLTASDGAADNSFGFSISTSEDYAIIGALWGDGNEIHAGSAYIFRKDTTGWIEEQKLIASDGSFDDLFGVSVSISGNYAIVSANQDDENGIESGSAYIFRKDSTGWIEVYKLLPSDGDAGDWFGNSVVIFGDYTVIGSPNDDDNGAESGSAYIYTNIYSIGEINLLRPNGGEIWLFGEKEDIIWSSENVIDVRIELSTDYGVDWSPIVDSIPSTGSYSWIVDSLTYSTKCLIKVTDLSNHRIFDISDSIFTIDVVPAVEDILYESIPIEYRLIQNFPNPFNPVTTIKYSIPELSVVILKVYDVLGNEIATLVNKEKPVGIYEVEFDATDLPSGIYFYRLQAGSFIEAKKMVLLR